jgi:hypothetical protein
VALLRRPGNATGLLMAAVGFLWLVGDLYWVPGALAFTIAATFALFYQVVLAHLALAFPSGRLPGRFERRVMVGLYAWTLADNLVRMLLFDPRAEGCAGCPANLLLLVHDAGLERWRNDVTSYLDTAVIVAVGAVIVRHWWRRTRAARYVIAPVVWAAGPAVAYLVTREVADDFVTLSPTGARIVYQFLPAGLAVWPLVFLVSLLRTRLDYAASARCCRSWPDTSRPGGCATRWLPRCTTHSWSCCTGRRSPTGTSTSTGSPASR